MLSENWVIAMCLRLKIFISAHKTNYFYERSAKNGPCLHFIAKVSRKSKVLNYISSVPIFSVSHFTQLAFSDPYPTPLSPYAYSPVVGRTCNHFPTNSLKLLIAISPALTFPLRKMLLFMGNALLREFEYEGLISFRLNFRPFWAFPNCEIKTLTHVGGKKSWKWNSLPKRGRGGKRKLSCLWDW